MTALDVVAGAAAGAAAGVATAVDLVEREDSASLLSLVATAAPVISPVCCCCRRSRFLFLAIVTKMSKIKVKSESSLK